MMSALADLTAYQWLWGLSTTQLTTLGDLTGEGMVTNADLQGLINNVANGGGTGSLDVVPEPTAWTQCILGAIALLLTLRVLQRGTSSAAVRFAIVSRVPVQDSRGK